MKIRIDRRTFASALAEVVPFAPQKAPVAILKNAKITTKGNRMKIEANDTLCSIVKYIELIECDEDGTFLIEASELNKFISKTKGDAIELSIEGNTVHISHSKGTADFQSSDPAEFPVFKMPEEGVTEVTLDSAYIAEAVSNARAFISGDTLRPQMCAIYAYIKDNEFGYCASDTCKLIHGNHPIAGVEGLDVHWFIMPPAFPTLLNACKYAESVRIQITDSHVSYRLGNIIIHTLQAKGAYPNFKRVIPQTWNIECAVDKNDLIEALGRMSLFCDTSQCVQLDISHMDMNISVDNILYMKSAKENVPHNGCDGDIKIGVNVNNALTSLNVFGDNVVLMRMTDASRPILFKQQDNDYLQVVAMPMSLNS